MIRREELLPIPEFVAVRAAREREAIRVKNARRFTVAGQLTFLFENRVTLLWQIQEMCRVEGITAPEAVQHEVDTYGALMPTADSLSATLLLEYADPELRARRLAELVGLHRQVALELDGERVAAVFDAEQFDERRLSSVQFLRFPLTPSARAALFDLGRPAFLRIDHPALQRREPLPAGLRGALAEDLARP